MISGAEIMVKCLETEGVKVVFGYPGAAICPFYDKLLDSDIKHILVREEQNAAHSCKNYHQNNAVKKQQSDHRTRKDAAGKTAHCDNTNHYIPATHRYDYAKNGKCQKYQC